MANPGNLDNPSAKPSLGSSHQAQPGKLKRPLQKLLQRPASPSIPSPKQRKSTAAGSKEPIRPVAAEAEDWSEAAGIVAVRKHKRRTLYIVRWTGIDPKSGEPWPDSEEPRSNLSPDLWREWRDWTSQHPDNTGRDQCFRLIPEKGWQFIEPPSPTPTPTSTTTKPSPSTERPSKRRRVVSSSPSAKSTSGGQIEQPQQPDQLEAYRNVVAYVAISQHENVPEASTGASDSGSEDSFDEAATAQTSPAPEAEDSNPVAVLHSSSNPSGLGISQDISIEDSYEKASESLQHSQKSAKGAIIPDSQSQDPSPIVVEQSAAVHLPRNAEVAVTVEGVQDSIEFIPRPPPGFGLLLFKEKSSVVAGDSSKGEFILQSAQGPDLAHSQSPQASLDLKTQDQPLSSIAPAFRVENSNADRQATSRPETQVPRTANEPPALVLKASPIAPSRRNRRSFSGLPGSPLRYQLDPGFVEVQNSRPASTIPVVRLSQSQESHPLLSILEPSSGTEDWPSLHIPLPADQHTFSLHSTAPPRPSTPSDMSDRGATRPLNGDGSRSATPSRSLFSRGFASKFPKKTEAEPDIATSSQVMPSSNVKSDALPDDSPEAQRINAPESLATREVYAPLPLYNHARVTLAGHLRKRGDRINKILTSDAQDSSPESQTELDSLFQELHDVASHPDLVEYGPLTQVSDRQQGQWNRSVSSKFHFIDSLFKNALDVNKRVALFVKPGSLMQLVEQHLRAVEVSFSRPDQNKSEIVREGGLKVDLLPTSSQGFRNITDHPDLIIGFDESFDANDDRLDDLRTGLDGQKCLVLKLVPLWSLEHIMLADRGILESSKARQMLLRRFMALKDVIGTTRKISFIPDRYEARADYVSDAFLAYLKDNDVSSIEQLSIIADFDVDEKIMKIQGEASNTGKKRPAPKDDDDTDLSVSKRAKNDYDSSAEQSDSLSDNSRPFRSEVLARRPQTVEQPSPTASDAVMTDAERALESNEELEAVEGYTIKDLPKILEAARRWKWDRDNFEKIFTEREDVHDETARARLEAEKRLAVEIKRAEAAEQRVAQLQAAAEVSREEISRLRKELVEERTKLETSSIPEHKEFELLRQRAAKVEALERKVANQDRDVDYIRTQYQDASHKAAESAGELQPLREENGQLRAKIEILKADMIGRSRAAALKTLGEELGRTQQDLKQRTKQLESVTRSLVNTQAELQEERDRAELARGMSTRAAHRADSQEPRSVRGLLGASLNPGSRPQSRNASRQSSPMPTARAAVHGPSALR